MRSLLPLSVYCISLLSLPQLLALPAERRPGTDRPDLLNKVVEQREATAVTSEDQADTAAPSAAPSPKWPVNVRRVPSSGMRRTSPNLAWARPDEGVVIVRRMTRTRRHAHTGSRGGHHYPHHAHLMRVGCNLGTCQVQNLSHRLYQLIGQSGREESSPINPRSPHSYG